MINDQSEYVVVGKNIFWYSSSPLDLVCLDLHVRLPISTLSCTDNVPPVTLPCEALLNVIFNKRPKPVILLNSIFRPYPHVPHFCACK